MKNVLLTFYLIFILITQILIKLEFYTLAFAFTIVWVLVYVVALIKAVKLKSKEVQEATILERILSKYSTLKKVINISLAIPVIILIILSFPFKEDYLYNLIVIYSINVNSWL